MFGQKIPAGVAAVAPDSRMTITASGVGQEGDNSACICKIWSTGQSPGFVGHTWVQISVCYWLAVFLRASSFTSLFI